VQGFGEEGKGEDVLIIKFVENAENDLGGQILKPYASWDLGKVLRESKWKRGGHGVRLREFWWMKVEWKSGAATKRVHWGLGRSRFEEVTCQYKILERL